MDREMADAARLFSGAAAPSSATSVTLLRIAIIVALLAGWEALAASGLLYRDVVPSLVAIAKAIWALLRNPEYYWHLGWTAGEIGLALLIGGTSGVLVGLVL